MRTDAYSGLFDRDRVHVRAFTDPGVFDAEMERIFHQWWIFVGHASEVPESGDYARKSMGRKEVIMSRDADGEIHLLLNRCRHRGNTVCHADKGNSSFFRCAYHGWTYKNDGRLTGVPYPKAYGDGFAREEYGLDRVPNIGIYRGFVFGKLADSTGPSFEEYLGPRVRNLIDDFVSASPSREVIARHGVSRQMYAGNWKFVGMDGYHPAFVHASVQDLVRRRSPNAQPRQTFSESGPNLSWDLGGGHVRLDQTHTKIGAQDRREHASLTEAQREYRRAMEAVHGAEVDEVIQRSQDPHLAIWPNLQLIRSQIRVIRPLAVNRTVIEIYATTLKDVPRELNVDRLRQHEWFNGPAGFGGPDDFEIFERNQIGLECSHQDSWLLLSRGSGREASAEDGARYTNITDELTQRGQLRQWQQVMSPEEETS